MIEEVFYDEIGRCDHLERSDYDWFLSKGVPITALQMAPGSRISPVRKDKVVLVKPGLFEFPRYLRTEEEVSTAYLFIAFDQFGDAADLVAWNKAMLATWCGNVALLGEEELCRFWGDHLNVHPTPLAWLRDSRYGAVIVDEKRAGEMLRSIPMRATSVEHGDYLRRICTAPKPRIVVPAMREAA